MRHFNITDRVFTIDNGSTCHVQALQRALSRGRGGRKSSQGGAYNQNHITLYPNSVSTNEPFFILPTPAKACGNYGPTYSYLMLWQAGSNSPGAMSSYCI